MATARMIFFYMIGSCLLYPILTYFMIGQEWGAPLQVASQHPMAQKFSYIAVGLLALSYIIPKAILKTQVRMTFSNKPSNSSQMSEEQVVKSMFLTFIVELALREAVAILGLILGHMTRSVEIAMLFNAVAVFGMVMKYPTFEKWKYRILWA